MIKFGLQTKGVEKALAMLEVVAPKQIPFIVAVAMTETARDVEFVVKRAIQTDVDRPKPYTINSLTSTRATKQKLEAVVAWRDSLSRDSITGFASEKGTQGGKYLRPIAEGGSRPLKRSESALRRQGLLPVGYYLVPGRDAKLDSYGNVPGSVYTQMLSALRAFSEKGYVANRTAKSQAKRSLPLWFAIKPGDKTRLAPGIYKRKGTKRELIFAMVRTPKYHVSFPFEGISRRTALERLPIQFNKAIDKALATAK